MTRQMVMVGFLQAQNCTNLPCSWRHPHGRVARATNTALDALRLTLGRSRAVRPSPLPSPRRTGRGRKCARV